ncbi:MAG: glycosyltransferase [Patescibacteria group bacterium]
MDEKKRPKIKIVYIMPTLARGGAEKFLTDLLLHLDRRTYDPTLILFKSGGPWLTESTTAGVPVIVLEKKYRVDPGNFWRLITILRRIKPTIVHTQLGGDLYGRLAAKLLGVPVILSTEQNVNPDEKWLTNILKRWTGAWADRIIAISRAVKTDLRQRYRVPESKIVIIPNGLDPAAFPPRPAAVKSGSSATLGTLGRLVPQKGHSVLIQALARIKHTNWQCQIAGEGPLRDELQRQIEAAGLAERVSLVGAVTDPAAFLSRLDIFILPSLWEGQGLVLLEAGLTGCPVIASEVDGIKELVTEETGHPVPAGDPAALAARIDDLLADLNGPTQWDRTRRLRELISADYDIQKIAALYQDLYQELLTAKGLI